MRILIFDTSTPMMIVALADVQEKEIVRLESQERLVALDHAGSLLLAVQEVFSRFGLSFGKPDVISCTQGPGSFTGLRIGLCTAKGLAEGWGVPLVGIDHLQAMAETVLKDRSQGSFALSIIDARKNRFYVRLFQWTASKVKAISPPQDLSAEEIFSLIAPYREGILTGYQPQLLLERGKAFLDDCSDKLWLKNWEVRPQTQWAQALVLQAARQESGFLASEAGPFYLRKSEAEENTAVNTMRQSSVKTRPAQETILPALPQQPR